MIKLTKLPEPQILNDNFRVWTDTLLARQAAMESPTATEKGRYNQPEIKSVLLRETNYKCAYCESKFGHVTYGDIEHIVPKSSDVSLTFQWSNLTIACDVCNTNKSTHFENGDDFVDPYLVDPQKHLFFAGPIIVPHINSDRGRLTEKLLDLNRVRLVERRRERMDHIFALIKVYAETKNPLLRTVLRADIEQNETSDKKEFAALSRKFISDLFKLYDE